MSETYPNAEAAPQPNEPGFEVLVHIAASVATQDYAAEVIKPWDQNWQTLMGKLRTSLPIDFSADKHMQTWRWHFKETKEIDDANSLWVVGKIHERDLPSEYPEMQKALQITLDHPLLTKKDDRPPLLGVEAARNPDKKYQYPRLPLLSRLVEVVSSHLDYVEVSGLRGDGGGLYPFDGPSSPRDRRDRYRLLQRLSSPLSSVHDMNDMWNALYRDKVSADASSIEEFLRKRCIAPDTQAYEFTLLGQVVEFLGQDEVCFDTQGRKLSPSSGPAF